MRTAIRGRASFFPELVRLLTFPPFACLSCRSPGRRPELQGCRYGFNVVEWHEADVTELKVRLERKADINMSRQKYDDNYSPARTGCSILAQDIPQDASFIIIRPATITTAANMRIGVAGSPRKYRPATNEPTAPIPVQMVYAVPSGNERIAAESKAKLAIIPTRVTIEYSGRVPDHHTHRCDGTGNLCRLAAVCNRRNR